MQHDIASAGRYEPLAFMGGGFTQRRIRGRTLVQNGKHNAPDSELFGWARTHGYIIFTHDLDFGAMLNATQTESPSVFQVRTNDVSSEALSPRTIELLHRFTPQLLSGALVVVDEFRERVRVLPLRSDPRSL